jgi:hypothetical protein
MGTMNSSEEAAASGLGGWLDGVTYMAGLSGGSWGTGSFMANGGMSPLDLVNNVGRPSGHRLHAYGRRSGTSNPTSSSPVTIKSPSTMISSLMSARKPTKASRPRLCVTQYFPPG